MKTFFSILYFGIFFCNRGTHRRYAQVCESYLHFCLEVSFRVRKSNTGFKIVDLRRLIGHKNQKSLTPPTSEIMDSFRGIRTNHAIIL